MGAERNKYVRKPFFAAKWSQFMLVENALVAMWKATQSRINVRIEMKANKSNGLKYKNRSRMFQKSSICAYIQL